MSEIVIKWRVKSITPITESLIFKFFIGNKRKNNIKNKTMYIIATSDISATKENIVFMSGVEKIYKVKSKNVTMKL